MMKADERFEMIIREVQDKEKVKVAQLSELLGCSEVTIRNDIRKLDEQGVIRKTHGGAEKLKGGLTVQFAQDMQKHFNQCALPVALSAIM